MKTKSRKIVYTALFAALTTVSIYVLHIPVGNGIVHLGDTFIYLGSVLLPFPYGIIAASVGGAMADLVSGYAVYIIPTFIVKAANALCFYAARSSGAKVITRRSVIAAVVSSLVTVIGYYFVAVVLYGGWQAQFIATAPGNLVQAGGSLVAFIALGLALDTAGVTRKIRL